MAAADVAVTVAIKDTWDLRSHPLSVVARWVRSTTRFVSRYPGMSCFQGELGSFLRVRGLDWADDGSVNTKPDGCRL